MDQSGVFRVEVTDRCVRVAGEVDIATAAKMVDAMLNSTLTDLDLSDVTFMDSGGLHALLRLQAGRDGFRVVAASRTVRRLFDLAGVAEQFMRREGDSAA